MSNSTSTENPAWQGERRPLGVGDLAAILFWTGAVAIYFWDAVALRRAFFYFDITEINFSYRDFLARELRLGRLSRWHPGLYCGMALYSESQAGYLHPLKFLLYPWMATWKAFNLDSVLSVWLTGLGTYGWLRRHVGPRGALTGAATFGLSGFVWAHFIHTSMNNALSSVPFVVWATEWAWERGRGLAIALGAFALACQVFAGHLQDTLLTAALIGGYALFRAATETGAANRLFTLGTAAAIVALGVALAAVQWVPSKELLDRSVRAGGLTWGGLTYGSWHPELTPTLVVREAYGTRARDTDWMDGFYPFHEMNAYLGLTAIALAVIGGAACRDRWVAFWVLVWMVGGVLMLGRFTCLFDYANRIPVVGSARIPVRFHLWVSLAVAALASVGVDRLERGFPVRLRAAGFTVGFLVLASIPILLYVYAPTLSSRGPWTLPYHVARYGWLGQELMVATARTLIVGCCGAAAIVLAARTSSPAVRRAACGALPLVIVADLLGAHWHDVPTIEPSYWTKPPSSARAIANDPAAIRVYGVAGRSAGEPGYASEPVDFMAVRDTLDWSLAPVWGLAAARGETPLVPRRSLGFTDHAKPDMGRFDLQSVTHMITSRRDPGAPGPGETAGAAVIYANAAAFPRARLMGRPFYVGNEAEALAAIDQLGRSIRERLVVEDPDRPLAPDVEVGGAARIVRDEPERIEVETDSAGPAYLVLSDTWDPGWSATVDGRPAPIRPAWSTFRAVFLEAGRHRVAFRYRPAGFDAGLTISLLGLASLVVMVVKPARARALRAEHAELPWPARWPYVGLVLIALLLAVSMVGLGRDGRLEISTRWDKSFHQFTWGAGIEAMRQNRGL